jgi:hypothetical protein
MSNVIAKAEEAVAKKLNDTHYQILGYIGYGSAVAYEIMTDLGLSGSTVFRSIKYLSSIGAVTGRLAPGKRRLYKANGDTTPRGIKVEPYEFMRFHGGPIIREYELTEPYRQILRIRKNMQVMEEQIATLAKDAETNVKLAKLRSSAAARKAKLNNRQRQ